MNITADAALVDLDGTLVDSTPIIVRCWTTWAEEFGLVRETFESIVTHGRTSEQIIADLLPADRRAAALRRIYELEEADVEGLTLLPGAADFVAGLPADRWAVVTSGTSAVAGVRIKATGLSPAVVVSADDVSRGKPDPEPFLLGAARLGVDPAQCVVVEDAPAGLLAARAAGMPTIAVATTYPAADLDADVVVEGLHQLRVDLDGGPLTVRTLGPA